MATRKRKVNVQVPGDVSTESPMADDGAVETGQAPAADQPAERVSEIIVEKVMTGRPIDADYAKMRADEIDPATLTRPVLTQDGWVVPHKPEAKKV